MFKFCVLILALNFLIFPNDCEEFLDEIGENDPLTLQGFIQMWTNLIDMSSSYLIEYEYFLTHNETVLELSKSLKTKAHSFKNSTLSNKMKSFTESSIGRLYLGNSAKGSEISRFTSSRSDDMTIRMALSALWEELKIPKDTFKIDKYKDHLETELLEKFLENYNEFKAQLIKDMIYIHKGEVMEILHNYKEMLKLVHTQKELLLEHNPNSTFIQPFRQIINGLRNSLSKTYDEIIYFSKSNKKLKLLSGNPNCYFKYNAGYSLLNKFGNRAIRSRISDCDKEHLPVHETKETLETIAGLLKFVIDCLPNVKAATESEYENDTEVLFHNFINLLSTLTEDAMQVLQENHAILDKIFDNIVTVNIVNNPNAMENYFKSSGKELKILCFARKALQDISSYANTTPLQDYLSQLKSLEYGNVEKLSIVDSAVLVLDIVLNAANDLIDDCEYFENPDSETFDAHQDDL